MDIEKNTSLNKIWSLKVMGGLMRVEAQAVRVFRWPQLPPTRPWNQGHEKATM